MNRTVRAEVTEPDLRAGAPSDRSPAAARVACAFVGLLDVDGRTADNPAYSPASTQFQESLLAALARTETDVTQVLALRPVPSYPARPLFFGSARATRGGSLRATLLPFINFGPLKTVSSGFALLPYLIAWAWRERHRSRVFLLFNLYSPPGIASVIAGWLSRTSVVAIVADIQVPGEGLLPATLMRRLDFQLQVKTLPLFDGLVVLTRRMASEFAPCVPCIQMEGAVPESMLPPLVRGTGDQSSRDGEGQLRPCIVMYAGGLSALKGIPLLLSAFERLHGDAYALWVTGRGPLEQMVVDAAARDGRITYFGFPSQRELLSLYARADVLVNPHSESSASARYLFPSKLIEYLATGRPVISTCSTPEVREVYADAAVILNDGDAEDLAGEIRRIARMSQAEREAIGNAGRGFVLREKTWDSQAHKISDFIASLVSRRTRSAE